MYQVVSRLKLGTFNCKTPRTPFNKSTNPHVLVTHTKGMAKRQLLRRATMETKASAASTNQFISIFTFVV
jgi:hypothetical protein